MRAMVKNISLIMMDNYLKTLIQHKFHEDLLSAKGDNKDELDITWSQKLGRQT